MNFVSLVAFLVLLSSICLGQTASEPYRSIRGLSSGTLLRIDADSLGPVCGKLGSVSTGADTVHLAPCPEKLRPKDSRELNYKPADQFHGFRPVTVSTSIATDDINAVYRKTNKGKSGALIGGITGASLMMLAAASWNEAFGNTTADADYAGAAIAGVIIGGGIGYLIGSIFPKWAEIYSRP